MRARSLKPGFFRNVSLAELPFGARILFEGLWCMADREGRLEEHHKRIVADIFPYDKRVPLESWLSGLDERGFILRYEIEGHRYIQIRKWTKHQQPHYKEGPSTLPPSPGHTDSLVQAFGVSAEQRQRILLRDKGKCRHCGSDQDLSIDHVVSRVEGGSGDDSNLQTLCRRCNSSKGGGRSSGGRSSPDDRSTIGQSSVNPDTRTPDSGLLTPDSGLLTPDSGLADRRRTPDGRERENTRTGGATGAGLRDMPAGMTPAEIERKRRDFQELARKAGR